MLTANKLMPQGGGLAAVLLKRAATVELDWDVRQKSRFDTTDSQGRQLGVFLPRGTAVRGGDVLVAEDGSLIRVTAAPQPVLVVRHCSDHGSPFDLLRAAYHLGNRHVALELQPDHLKLEPDHVLADLLRQMHLIVSEEQTALLGEVMLVDRFGHLVTNIDRRRFDQFRHDGLISIAVDGQVVDRLVATYAEAPAGSICALFGSSDHLELALNGGNAAHQLGLGRGAVIRVDRG